MHFGLTFGACTIASVSYIGTCTTIRGNTVELRKKYIIEKISDRTKFRRTKVPKFRAAAENFFSLKFCLPKYITP